MIVTQVPVVSPSSSSSVFTALLSVSLHLSHRSFFHVSLSLSLSLSLSIERKEFSNPTTRAYRVNEFMEIITCCYDKAGGRNGVEENDETHTFFHEVAGIMNLLLGNKLTMRGRKGYEIP